MPGRTLIIVLAMRARNTAISRRTHNGPFCYCTRHRDFNPETFVHRVPGRAPSRRGRRLRRRNCNSTVSFRAAAAQHAACSFKSETLKQTSRRV